MAKAAAKRKTTPKVTIANPRSLEEKIALTEALLAKYKAQLVSDTIKNDIADGDDVDFTYGRGDKKRTLTGTVAGMVDTPQGKIVAVSTKDEIGLPVVYRVNIRDLTANRTADERRAANPAEADEEPLNAD